MNTTYSSFNHAGDRVPLYILLQDASPVFVPKVLWQYFVSCDENPHEEFLSLAGLVLDECCISCKADEEYLFLHKCYFVHNLEAVCEELNNLPFHKLLEKMRAASSADDILGLLSEQAYMQLRYKEQIENHSYLCRNLAVALNLIKASPSDTGRYHDLCEKAARRLDEERLCAFLLGT